VWQPNELDRTGERADLPNTECSQSPVTNLNIYYTPTKTEMCSLLQNVPYFKKVFDLRKIFQTTAYLYPGYHMINVWNKNRTRNTRIYITKYL
jgi:hypothetical protein